MVNGELERSEIPLVIFCEMNEMNEHRKSNAGGKHGGEAANLFNYSTENQIVKVNVKVKVPIKRLHNLTENRRMTGLTHLIHSIAPDFLFYFFLKLSNFVIKSVRCYSAFKPFTCSLRFW